MHRPLKVSSVIKATDEIKVYELVDAEGADLPAFEAGAHLEIRLSEQFVRHYSLCNDPAERRRYVIAVKRDAQGRGGSAYMHDHVGEGTILADWKLRNTFALDETAANYILVAGGIGITPMLPMMARLKRIGRPFTLHYCAKSSAKAAFREQLEDDVQAGRVVFHYSEEGAAKRWQVSDAIGAAERGTRLYCCGPATLIAAVRDAAASWPQEAVHFEFFSAASSLSPESDEEFLVQTAPGGAAYPVPPDKTILRVLRENGIYIESACEAGACGTCRVRYVGGVPDHRDLYLTDDERKEFIMLCVSRSRSPCLILDLER